MPPRIPHPDASTSKQASACPLRRSAMLALVVLSGCAAGPGSTPVSATHDTSQPAAKVDANTAVQAPISQEADVDQRFAQWMAKLRDAALAAGIDEATLHAGLDGVKLRPHAVEQDRAQPEFTRTLWEYLDSVITP